MLRWQWLSCFLEEPYTRYWCYQQILSLHKEYIGDWGNGFIHEIHKRKMWFAEILLPNFSYNYWNTYSVKLLSTHISLNENILHNKKYIKNASTKKQHSSCYICQYIIQRLLPPKKGLISKTDPKWQATDNPWHHVHKTWHNLIPLGKHLRYRVHWNNGNNFRTLFYVYVKLYSNNIIFVLD